MDGLGGGEIIAKMLQATKRLANALFDRGAPRISEIHHEFPRKIRGGVERAMHEEDQAVSGYACAGKKAGADYRGRIVRYQK